MCESVDSIAIRGTRAKPGVYTVVPVENALLPSCITGQPVTGSGPGLGPESPETPHGRTRTLGQLHGFGPPLRVEADLLPNDASLGSLDVATCNTPPSASLRPGIEVNASAHSEPASPSGVVVAFVRKNEAMRCAGKQGTLNRAAGGQGLVIGRRHDHKQAVGVE